MAGDCVRTYAVEHEAGVIPARIHVQLRKSYVYGGKRGQPPRQLGAAAAAGRDNAAFHWQLEFVDVFAGRGSDGGFDAIIGNPPYIRIRALKQTAPRAATYYPDFYLTARGNFDIYALFVERGLALLRPHGRLGFILPNKFFDVAYGEPLRQLLAERRMIAEIVDFGAEQVFPAATTYTCLLFLDSARRDQLSYTRVRDLAA